MKKLLALVMVLTGVSSFATQTPLSFPQDKRIKRVAFSENNVIPIYGHPFTSTQILFGPDESVLDVEGGDSEGWMATYHKNVPNMLFIKPSVLDSRSNMTVVTNKHTYYFSVASSKSLADKSPRTYAIKFIYPEDERLKLKATLSRRAKEKAAILSAKKNPKSYNWDYAFNGDKTIMPAHVFDDGTFTYLELRANQDVPAVFAIDNNKGEEALVNVSRQGQYLVIHRLAPQLSLRAGKHHVASIFNNRMIRAIKRG